MTGNKRKQRASSSGVVLSWQTDDSARNRGFGFIECADGRSLFCHRLTIKDGDALWPGTAVTFDEVDDERRVGERKAINVHGGVCFDHSFRKRCGRKGCSFSHAGRPQAPGREQPSLDEAVAAVVAARGVGGPPPLLVDTVEACASECARLKRAGVVAVDFEGVNLCRDGELLLAQLAAADGPVVLVDCFTLGQAAFDQGGLRELLQSEEVLKLVFDGRSDADALHHLFDCSLKPVCDCQVLFTLHLDERQPLTGGRGSGSAAAGGKGGAGGVGGGVARLPGLAKALAACPSLSDGGGRALSDLKKAVLPTFVPELGGSYEAWRARPLPPALIEYAAADVVHLHAIRAAWGHLLSEDAMRALTARRIAKAIGGDGRAKGPHMALRDF
jgi:cold shock CspA family protein